MCNNFVHKIQEEGQAGREEGKKGGRMVLGWRDVFVNE
jgi:hypothetical protein